MPKVRRALGLLDELGLDLWTPADAGGSTLLVAPNGEIFVRTSSEILNLNAQPVLLPKHALGLTAPFQSEGIDGPNLVRPRPHLRIVRGRSPVSRTWNTLE